MWVIKWNESVPRKIDRKSSFQSWGYIIALLDGLAKIDWKRANTVVHNEKNVGDKTEMNAKYGIDVDDLIRRTERMCEIDWNSFYAAFGNKNNSLTLSKIIKICIVIFSFE